MLDIVKRKTRGSVYTPDFIVSEMLDFVGYREGAVSRKHIIDNSCGDGAFLKSATEIYCRDFFTRSSDLEKLKAELETYIHGVEIDADALIQCRSNLDEVALKFGLLCINWDLRCADALTVKDFNGKMDFVVGNPPYVRIHNLGEAYPSVKEFSFGRSGMTDLFIVFFEVGFNMLSPRGRMVQITPSSWLTSAAGQILRQYICREHNLIGVIDLEHFQAFSATTYSLISLFQKGQASSFSDYFTYNSVEKKRHFRERLLYADFSFDNGFYFSCKKALSKFKAIRNACFDFCISVKNGFATLADSIFIGDFDFCSGTIDVVKASTGEWRRCIFPYDEQGNALSPEQMESHSEAYAVLKKNQEKLKSGRDVRELSNWFLFGRTQALRDVCKNKVAVNSIVRDKDSLKLTHVPAGKGVYGGLYILTDLPIIVFEEILRTDEFFDYVHTLKNYKSGGYYTFSSKDLARFINFKLKDKHYDQSRVSQRYFSFI